MNFDLSIIIINYNTPELTINCLDSISQSDLKNINLELIIVDNDSKPSATQKISKYLKTFPIKYILIKNTQNLGFGAANNIGIKKANGKYILLLNSDTIVKKGTISKQLKFARQNPDYRLSTCKILLESGKIDPACHRGFPTPWASFTYFSRLEKLFPKCKLFSAYHQSWKDLNKPHQVDVISGCFFFANKKVYDQVGYFDTDYFMYAEDIDLCYRLTKKDLKIGFNPSTTITHLKSQSGGRTSHHFWQSMKIFYRKHYQKKYSRILNQLVYKVLDYKVKHP